jgi:hypothetical protein
MDALKVVDPVAEEGPSGVIDRLPACSPPVVRATGDDSIPLVTVAIVIRPPTTARSW